MYSLIIADDEEIERKAFRLLIDRNFPEIAVLDDAVNGIDFVDKVVQMKPDIAIVDINMPGLNGLEAVKMLKHKGITSKIIIHTAYSEFEYAQEALALGADDYILKPIKRDKIIATIRSCLNRIEEERQKEVEHSRFKKIVEELMPVIETDFMSSILLGDIDRDNLLMYMDILGIKFISGFIMTIYIPVDEINSAGNDEVSRNSLKKEILNLIKSEVRSICNCMVSSVISNKISLFIPVDDSISRYRFRVWSIELAELVIEKVKKTLGIKLNAGIGKLYQNIEDLTKSYKESVNALMDKTVSGTIKHFDDLFCETPYQNPLQKYENEILKLITACNYEECSSLIGKVFSEMERFFELDSIKEMLLGLMALIQKLLVENNILNTQENYSYKAYFNAIMRLNSALELEHWMKTVIKNIISAIANEKRSKINSFVKQAIEYINRNYTRDISLDNVAESIGISSYYLSRLFKQELDRNFIDYLTETRVKRSIELLKEKDYSIKELSESVGYSNPTYFCKVFKKLTGKTIREFRESLSI